MTDAAPAIVLQICRAVNDETRQHNHPSYSQKFAMLVGRVQGLLLVAFAPKPLNFKTESGWKPEQGRVWHHKRALTTQGNPVRVLTYFGNSQNRA